MKLQYRVLVLEDDENALAGIVELLSESGYDVTPTSAYEDAKRILSGTTFDLFVTDVRLRSYQRSPSRQEGPRGIAGNRRDHHDWL